MAGFAGLGREVEKKRARRTLDAHDRRPRPVAPPKQSKPGGLAGLAHSIVKAAAQLPIGPPIPGMGIRAGEFAHPVRLARNQAHGFAEATGINSVRRIRKGQGDWMDKLAVGSMALPFAGRAVTAARMAPKLGIIAGGLPQQRMINMAKTARNAGNKQANPLRVQRAIDGARAEQVHFGDQNLPEIMLQVARKPPAHSKNLAQGKLYSLQTLTPAQQARGFAGRGDYANRLPVITHKKTGTTFVGWNGSHHGDLIAKAKERYPDKFGGPGRYDDWVESEVYNKFDDESYGLVPSRINWGVYQDAEERSLPAVEQAQYRILRQLAKEGHHGNPKGRIAANLDQANANQLTQQILSEMPEGGVAGVLHRGPGDPQFDSLAQALGMDPEAFAMIRARGASRSHLPGVGHGFLGPRPPAEGLGFFAPESHNPWKLSDVAKRKRAAAKAKTVRAPKAKGPFSPKPTRKGRKLNAVDMERARALAAGAQLKDEHDRRKKRR